MSRFEVPCIRTRRVSAEWRCIGSMAWGMAPLRLETVWLHCDEAQQVGCLRGLESCVGRRHPVTIRKALLMAGSMRRV